MGRSREFDEKQAVSAAAEVFRSRGYIGASVDHLVAATGVHRGSLYGVFGSKHGMFVRVLDSLSRSDLHSGSADQGPDGVNLRLDLLLIALVELAPTDPRVCDLAAGLIRSHGITSNALGRRLLERARVSVKEEIR